MKRLAFFLILSVNLLHGCSRQPTIYTKKNLHDLETVRQICEEMKNEEELRNFKAHVIGKASKAGSPDIVGYIISTGDVDLNRTWIRDGETPLHYAIEGDHMEVFELLLKHGADVHKESMLLAPLMWAVRAGDLRKVELLLEYGAEINKVSSDITALHIATAMGNPSIVRFLLANGADVNINSASGCRPIHIAAWCNRVEIAKILLKNGADTSVKCDGHAVLEMARSNEFGKLLK